MKKEYSKPSMKAYQIKPSQIICGSGRSTEYVRNGNPGTDEEFAFTSGVYHGD